MSKIVSIFFYAQSKICNRRVEIFTISIEWFWPLAVLQKFPTEKKKLYDNVMTPIEWC